MSTTAQDRLFHLIKELIPPEVSVADAVSEILHVSTDSAYRRIRGETPLVLEEVMALCRHFNLSLGQLLENRSDAVVFRNTRIHIHGYSYFEYLKGLRAQLNELDRFSQKEIIYMSKDLPIFHNFYFRPLIAFRYFFWLKIHLQDPAFEHKLFTIDMVPPAVEQMSKDLVKIYTGIPSTEMWNMESINSTISQIEFSRALGHFENNSEIRKVYDALEDSIYHIREQAEYGCKFMPGENPELQTQNLKFLFNRVVLGDNTIITVADEQRTAFINYGHLNYLMTTDEVFCNDLYHDVENLIRRSTQLSDASERQRNVFFNILLSKIHERKLNTI